jgi:hypothetical protein
LNNDFESGSSKEASIRELQNLIEKLFDEIDVWSDYPSSDWAGQVPVLNGVAISHD